MALAVPILSAQKIKDLNNLTRMKTKRMMITTNYLLIQSRLVFP